MAKFNRDDVDKFHDYSLYVPKRTIYMGSETDALLAEGTIKNLTILEGMNSEPITIIMNNIGGETYHGLAIYDAIKACKSRVTIMVYGHAMSMGSVILQAADERIMAPTARQMIHYGTLALEDHAKTVQKWAQESDKLDAWVEKMYLDRIHEKDASVTMKKLKKLLDHDTFLTAEESVKLGLADKVLGQDDEA